ncbi:tetratricopeptide repeat protein [Mucilaginibacter sp. Bleaf8]|uniref:tetratricopeptide repeat protein n=1 Tax=Mucilaginibacter sp. Bleaf8 TaxID=2834430 RepID=UPI001BCDCBEA|nr:tetratricopeptide repeat protein [Mucilaginibacter sp. Bleaf8]MBS7564593.1 tetratricopeptide repeat protein [Mucilaginibacter sp. Bleaf8]
MRLSVILSFLLVSSLDGIAQKAYVQLGYQAMMNKDFKSAVRQLEKACEVDSNSTHALWMLGYSYFHSENYKKSVSAYSRVIALNPTDESAYYFRSKAQSNMAKDGQISVGEREKCLLNAIKDLNRALVIKPNEDRFYQNRGLAYRDYADLKLQPSYHSYDKNRGITALKAAVSDFERVLNNNPSRADISNLLEVAKERMATLVGHR